MENHIENFIANILDENTVVQELAEVYLTGDTRTFRTPTYYGDISIADVFLDEPKNSLVAGKTYTLAEQGGESRRWIIRITGQKAGGLDNTRFSFDVMHPLGRLPHDEQRG